MIKKDIFITSIFELNLNIDLFEIKTLCINSFNQFKGLNTLKVSNYNGWHSPYLKDKPKELESLFKEIYKNIEEIYSLYKISSKLNPNIHEYWININKTNNFNLSHYHKNSDFSAIFYVETPENCGDLVFEHPALNFDFNLDKLLFNSKNEYNSNLYNVKAEAGKLIIFPSWLKHYVEPNFSDQNRISIAFNITSI